MLLLTRRIGEKIFIGENHEVTIQVVQINGGQVKIGIDAAKDVPILREEVYLRDNFSISINLQQEFKEG